MLHVVRSVRTVYFKCVRLYETTRDVVQTRLLDTETETETQGSENRPNRDRDCLLKRLVISNGLYRPSFLN